MVVQPKASQRSLLKNKLRSELQLSRRACDAVDDPERAGSDVRARSSYNSICILKTLKASARICRLFCSEIRKRFDKEKSTSQKNWSRRTPTPRSPKTGKPP